MTDSKVLDEDNLKMVSGGANENPNFDENSLDLHYTWDNWGYIQRCPHCKDDAKKHDGCFDGNHNGSIFRCRNCGWIDWSSAFDRHNYS